MQACTASCSCDGPWVTCAIGGGGIGRGIDGKAGTVAAACTSTPLAGVDFMICGRTTAGATRMGVGAAAGRARIRGTTRGVTLMLAMILFIVQNFTNNVVHYRRTSIIVNARQAVVVVTWIEILENRINQGLWYVAFE